MDVGAELRQARERRGISLQQISNVTKISPRVLQAIEAADEGRLPALVFTRSFVKSYAAEVDLDPEDTLRRYLAQFEPAVPPVSTGEAEAVNAAQDGAPEPAHESPRYSPGRVLQGRFGRVTLGALIGIVALSLVTRRSPEQEPSGRAPQVEVKAAGLAPLGPPRDAAVGTSGTLPPPDVIHITMAPTGPCWTSAVVNEQRVFALLMNAGDTRSVDAKSDVTLRIGDPAACRFTVNGKPAHVPGAAGKATTVRVTRENYTQLLAR